MPLIAPVLDDRSFDQLRQELVDRIRVYNPEWTDYNRSDPAITLLELYAYLGEGLQFRFNQIPEATQLAFLKLLNLPLRPAQAASALLRCTGKLPGGVALAVGDQLKAGKLPFTVETETQIWPVDCVSVSRQADTLPDEASEPELHAVVQASIDALAQRDAQLKKVAAYRNVLLEADGSSPVLDFSASVDGCVWIAVLKDPALTLTPPQGRALRLNIGYSPAAVTPTLAQISACDGPSARGPGLQWRASLATLDAQQQPRYLNLRLSGDSSAGFTQEGVVRVELPEDLTQLGVPQADDPALAGSGEFPPQLDEARAKQLWFWLRVWRSDESRIGATRLICVNAVQCRQFSAVTPASAELLGSGNGQPRQVFQLANTPLLSDAQHPVQLQVEENKVWSDWQQQDDLDASGADDRHFMIDAEAGTVMFGERFPQLGERVRVLGYRYGGGSAGNVPAQAINKFATALAAIAPPPAPMQRAGSSNFTLSNPFAAQGGADSESIAEGLLRIPGELRRRSRAVTRDDFSELAMMTPGVQLGRAECLPLFYAPQQVSPRAGVVSVVIWPAQDALHPNAPQPDAYQLKQVCQWLDSKRLVTTELYVIPPTYRRIAVSLALKVKDGYGLDAVRDWTELLLRQYLAPLPPYGPDGRGWPLGRRVFDRELEGAAMQVEGVEYVSELRLAAQDAKGAWQAMSSVELQSWEVPELAAVSIVDDNTALPEPGADLPPPDGDPAVPIPVLREAC